MTSRTVLVVEDDEDILSLVTKRLRLDGYDVIEARDGEEGLELAREQKPSIAILDLGLPGIDGLEVLRGIRADAELRGMIVVLLTARAQEADVRRGFEGGADAYVRKPFSPTKLSESVSELVKRQASGGA
ncbi:MAG TPA: response regulator [Gaiellaceae bacterium]|nr:response regulator [Gaiellaceae bacterium]